MDALTNLLKIGNKEAIPQNAYGCLDYFGMKIHKVSFSKEEAEKLWNEFDTNKKGAFDREKDAEKIDQIFSRIGDAFVDQIFQANSADLEEAKQKIPSGNARELKKFNKHVEKAKVVIKKEITSKSCVAHFLRAAKLSSSGKIGKDHFVSTLEEGAEFEKQGLKWLGFNKYTGPIIPPRESKMIPSQATTPSTITVTTSDSKTLTPPLAERKLSPEEQFRRSRVQIALKPSPRKDQKERHSQVPRTSAQPGHPKKAPEKTNLAEQKIVESEEEEKAEKIVALQAEKDRLAQELESLKQQAVQQQQGDTVLQGPPGT